jgi:ketosteroid isomerase-like protein
MATSDGVNGTEILRASHEAFERGDRQGVLDHIAEDATWHVFGGSSFAGSVQGRDAIWERFFAPLMGAPSGPDPQIHDILESDEHVVALGEVVFDLPDGERRFKSVEVYHHEDGQLTERWFFTDRRDELDEVLDRIAGGS